MNPLPRSQNQWPQWATVLTGSALAVYGLTRNSKTGLALAATGGVLAAGAISAQRSAPYETHASFQIKKSPEELYRFWRQLDNLPKFMQHLESVKVIDERTSQWTARGPLGAPITWRAEIVDESPDQWIVWRSLPGSAVDTYGSVQFRPAPGGRGTFVIAVMYYQPVGGPVGQGFAALFGKDPEITVREDLRRFKQLMEAGVIPTTQGQSHGPRSLKTRAAQAATWENVKPLEGKTPAAARRTA